MKFFNTLSRKKETFKPIDEKLVTLYTCGPTVYNYAHIGNFRAYLFEDILRRWIKYNGYKIKQIMNLTDVDDKTIRDSQKEKISLKEFTEKYISAFFEDIQTLRIEKAEEYPKATEHIKEMVEMIKVLLQKEIAYKTEDGIYFSIEKFPKYGELAHIDIEQLKTGASGRVKSDEYEKENASDFALWKFWDEKDGDVYWETEIGKGRPGWHIECSAMSAKHLTSAFINGKFDKKGFKTIDIHTGGVDNLFPHHEDEKAQTEACTGKKFVKYWMHCEHLLVDGKKMSKSLGNFYTLRDLIAKGYNPIAIRYLLISSHYRQKLNFTLEALEGANTAVQRINDFYKRLDETGSKENKEIEKTVEKAQKQFEKSLSDDIEMSGALASVFELMNAVNKQMPLCEKDSQLVKKFMDKINTILEVIVKEEPLTTEQEKLLKERENARTIKNWTRADELREQLKKQGILVEDKPNGQRWKRIL